MLRKPEIHVSARMMGHLACTMYADFTLKKLIIIMITINERCEKKTNVYMYVFILEVVEMNFWFQTTK